MTTLVGLDLTGRRVLVVGAGAVGTRRARRLVEDGAQVVLVDPRPSDDALRMASHGDVSVIERGVVDGDVDGADLTVWKNQFGVAGGADADNDGDSDGADFLVWQRNLGTGVPNASAATAVPEPAAWALAAISLCCLRSRRRVPNRS